MIGKLKGPGIACLLRRGAAALCALALSGCPAPAPRVAAPASVPAPPPPRAALTYTILPAESLLTIRVYRGGALAAAGHNHVIASHDLSGHVYVADEPLASGCEVQLPLESLSVDERELRLQAGPDFPPDVPDSAREGTRRNMLGPALLAALDYPQIVLSCVRLEASAPPQGGTVQAHLQALVRGTPHELQLPVHWERNGTRLVLSGETALKQSELGLKPFSAMLGALQVQDEMQVAFRILAQAPER
ncbi:MAG TPA: YceI family protein [Steroidobacteraceae bacterium]|nr:YceI family protein [Steroidobacteraceae bacterium]